MLIDDKCKSLYRDYNMYVNIFVWLGYSRC